MLIILIITQISKAVYSNNQLSSYYKKNFWLPHFLFYQLPFPNFCYSYIYSYYYMT